MRRVASIVLASMVGVSMSQMCPGGNAPVATSMQFLFPVNATGGIPGYGPTGALGNETASWGLALVGKSCWISKTVASPPESGSWSGDIIGGGPWTEGGSWTSSSGSVGIYTGMLAANGTENGIWNSTTSSDSGTYSGTMNFDSGIAAGIWNSTISGDSGIYSGIWLTRANARGAWTSSRPGANNTVFSYLFDSTLNLDLGVIYDYSNHYTQAAAGVMPAIYDTTQPGGALQYNTTYALPYNPDIWYDDEGREGFLMQSGGTNITFWSNNSVQVDVWNPVVGSPRFNFKNGMLRMKERVAMKMGRAMATR